MVPEVQVGADFFKHPNQNHPSQMGEGARRAGEG